jgi:hypothetical protein
MRIVIPDLNSDKKTVLVKGIDENESWNNFYGRLSIFPRKK